MLRSSSKASSLSSVSKAQKSPSSFAEKSESQSPSTSEFEYVGRLVTHERPVLKKSSSSHHTHYRSRPQISEEDSVSAADDYNIPVGIVKVNDRHTREIYRVPTPPPQVRQVYHRARSPKPKIIERVYVRRPAPEIIENIIGIPPERVEIINREKILPAAKPIIRTKFVHLKAESEQQRQPSSSSNLQATGYTPSHFGAHQVTNPPIPQATCYSYQLPTNFTQQYNQY